jgi:nitrogenase molybdenum-iron protein alpha/beta subunit
VVSTFFALPNEDIEIERNQAVFTEGEILTKDKKVRLVGDAENYISKIVGDSIGNKEIGSLLELMKKIVKKIGGGIKSFKEDGDKTIISDLVLKANLPKISAEINLYLPD